MIIDLDKFIAAERPVWNELEQFLNRMANNPQHRLDLDRVRRFHYLYERTSADLGKLTTFASEPDTRRYLEALVARAYGEIHETRERQQRLSPIAWFFGVFPRTFRRHARAFYLTVLITVVGCLFGGFATAFDPDSRHATMAFGHDRMRPSERVQQEENQTLDRLAGAKSSFSAFLMTHNTRVSILTLALGMTWAVGTVIALFYNGVILGAICTDYISDGQSAFLAGWLLPHGSIEIPAILIAGQAGLVLGHALIGWGQRTPLSERLRLITPDLATLIGGVAVLLVWAGFIEAFFSQYHEPVLPYLVKIAFGLIELALLNVFLLRSGQATGFRYTVGDMNVSRPGTLVIRTPEGISFSLLLAGPVTRFLAWGVDVAVLIGLVLLLGAVVNLIGLISFDVANALSALVFFIVQFGYRIASEWFWRGQTIGKRLLRLRVVDAAGLRIHPSQIVIRNLLRAVDFLPACYVVGGIASVLSPRSQRLGDFAANTIVIREPLVTQPNLDQLLSGKFNSLREHPHLAARLRQNVSPGEAAVAFLALLRRDELVPDSRVKLFGELATHFRSKVEFPPEAIEGLPDEQFVRNVVDVIYRTRNKFEPAATPASQLSSAS